MTKITKVACEWEKASSASPSTPRVAVVGAGPWGEKVATSLKNMGALAAVIDTNKERSRQLSERLNVLSGTDLDSACESFQFDAVAVVTDAPRHADVAVRAFNLGKHVYVEKPLALSTNDARAIVEAQLKSGKIGMVGHLMAFHPCFKEIAARIIKGDIGAPRYALSTRYSYGQIRGDENVFHSLAPHDISMAIRLFGTSVQRVEASACTATNGTNFDLGHLTLKFEQGEEFVACVSRISPSKLRQLVVIGTRGCLVWEDNPSGNTLGFSNVAGYSLPDRKPIFSPIPFQNELPLDAEMAEFLSAIREHRDVFTPIEEGLIVTELIERGLNAVSRQRGQTY